MFFSIVIYSVSVAVFRALCTAVDNMLIGGGRYTSATSAASCCGDGEMRRCGRSAMKADGWRLPTHEICVLAFEALMAEARLRRGVCFDC